MQGSDQAGHSNVCKVVTKWDTLMCATSDQTGHFNVGPPYIRMSMRIWFCYFCSIFEIVYLATHMRWRLILKTIQCVYLITKFIFRYKFNFLMFFLFKTVSKWLYSPGLNLTVTLEFNWNKYNYSILLTGTNITDTFFRLELM